ncbi:MAG: methyltransferase domain-containing protein [Gemmatimonadota bacterium]|nr:MAG: methyltransferase domain-containing protein [Gemmatimonadota bacterium]
MTPTDASALAPSTPSQESAVKSRYAEAAEARAPQLCCPVDYEPAYLEAIPEEVIEKDYGCGNPSRYLRPGETVLDLGSGTGKICFISAQVVGPSGRVIGVDMTPEMLEVARRNAPIVAERLGYANVEFRRGRIQDLAVDLDLLEQRLRATPVDSAEGFLGLEDRLSSMRERAPLVADESVDVVVSNCVLNLVATDQKASLFGEIHRVLRNGGRAVISDIVSDEPVPEALQRDADLWTGCVSGALTEEGFLAAFEDVGFYGIRVLERPTEPWQTVGGIEFRSLTVEAFKGKDGLCWERNQAVIYKGPFKEVLDDDGHKLIRGSRQAVCDKTFRILSQAPYAEHFDLVEPRVDIPLDDAKPFDCSRTALRHPRETKGEDYDVTTDAQAACCDPGAGC